MSEIKRYEPYLPCEGQRSMDEDESGSYVGYDEYIKLEAELSATQKKLEAAEAALTPHPPRDGIYPWAVALEPVANHARYWQEGARKVEKHGEALMCVDQAVNSWKNACYAYAEKCYHYEASIKASQEQEPVAWMVYEGLNCTKGWVTQTHPNNVPEQDKQEHELRFETIYAAPVIPPDVAELQRENAELTRKLDGARNGNGDYEDKIFELNYNLSQAEERSQNYLAEIAHLTKLLAEARSETVPKQPKES